MVKNKISPRSKAGYMLSLFCKLEHNKSWILNRYLKTTTIGLSLLVTIERAFHIIKAVVATLKKFKH